MIECKKCGYKENESLVELHHKLPKFMGGSDKDGRVYLCKKHHDIIHKMIPKKLYELIEDKNNAKKVVLNFTEWYINKK